MKQYTISDYFKDLVSEPPSSDVETYLQFVALYEGLWFNLSCDSCNQYTQYIVTVEISLPDDDDAVLFDDVTLCSLLPYHIDEPLQDHPMGKMTNKYKEIKTYHNDGTITKTFKCYLNTPLFLHLNINPNVATNDDWFHKKFSMSVNMKKVYLDSGSSVELDAPASNRDPIRTFINLSPAAFKSKLLRSLDNLQPTTSKSLRGGKKQSKVLKLKRLKGGSKTMPRNRFFVDKRWTSISEPLNTPSWDTSMTYYRDCKKELAHNDCIDCRQPQSSRYTGLVNLVENDHWTLTNKPNSYMNHALRNFSQVNH